MSSFTKNSKIYLICGVALAAVATFGVYSALSKTENLVPQVVAVEKIEPRTKITDRMIRVKNVPALGRSDTAIDDPALVIDGYATTTIFPDQAIVQPMVAKQFDETGSSGLAFSILDSHTRAISVKVEPENIVGGKVTKGDTVDIIVSIDGSKLGTKTGLTKTIFQKIEVFDYSKDTNSLTLLMSLEQIEVLLHAQNIGKVVYALVPGNAETHERTIGVVNANFCSKYGFDCSGAK